MKTIITSFLVLFTLAATAKSPVAVEWRSAGETMPAAVARPFGGFLPDGRFLVAGGSYFDEGVKKFSDNVYVRSTEGKWSKVGELPHDVAEGVTCEIPTGIFCAGGTDGEKKFTDAFVLSVDNGKPVVSKLPPLPEPVVMGAAAADGTKVYVVASLKIYVLDTADPKEWKYVGLSLSPAREQHVAAIQNGDQKEKVLVVYGGYDIKTKQPIDSGMAVVLSRVNPTRVTPAISSSSDKVVSEGISTVKVISRLPENTTTIGAAFLPSGHQHILLVGGFGKEGWIDRALKGSEEIDPVKLGWQRKILAYNCVTDAWCEYGEIAKTDRPRCGAAAGIRSGKTPEQYTLMYAPLAFLLLTATRMARTVVRDLFYALDRKRLMAADAGKGGVSRILVYGAGLRYRSFRRELVRSASANNRFIVGLIDDDLLLRGKFIGGVEVMGTLLQAPEIIKKTRADAVVIACDTTDAWLKVVRETLEPTGVKTTRFRFSEETIWENTQKKK